MFENGTLVARRGQAWMVMSETGIDDGWESMMNVVTVVQDKFSKLRSKPMVHIISLRDIL